MAKVWGSRDESMRYEPNRDSSWTASIKDNKALRLEVHHAKSFNDICKENNITTIKQALACKEIWSLDNAISVCYDCHKSLEKLRTKMKNMFIVDRQPRGKS
jgi:hypothetical protein